MNTIRLFEEDPYMRTFEANVTLLKDFDGLQGVILDRTCFYPTSGGQPHDRGELEGIPVVDVVEEGETIVHVLDGSIQEVKTVRGEIDWERRFGHMQQHTGQHVLSQAFVQAAEAETIGFHLGEERSTLDLNRADISAEVIAQTEQFANRIVFEDREVLIRHVPFDQRHTVPLRKPPKEEDDLRVVEIQGFDFSGCCGTHVRRTGEVGMIKVVRWERYKGGTRVTFLCGERALRDYQKKTDVLRDVCQTMTAGEDDVPAMVLRWKEEKKAAARRIKSLLEETLKIEALQLLDESEPIGTYKLITRLFENRDPGEVQSLVGHLVRHEGIVALIGLKEKRAHLYFGRSSSVEVDVRPWMEEACRIVQGRGGGSPSMARGSGEAVSKIEEAIQRVRTLCVQAMG